MSARETPGARAFEPSRRLRVEVAAHPSYPTLDAATFAVRADQVGRALLTLPTDPRRVWSACVAYARFAAATAPLEPYAGKLIVDVAPEDATPRLARALVAMRRLRATARFAAAALGDGAMPIMLASAGVPVILELDGSVSAASASALVEYFLTSPTLTAPIEPFFSIARHLGQGAARGPSVRDAYRETLGAFLHVDAERRVSLSRRLARLGVFFGTLDDRPEVLGASQGFLSLEGLERRLLAAPARCAFCPHFLACRGFPLAAEASVQASCAPWEQVHETLRQSFLAARAAHATSVAGGRPPVGG